MSARKVKPNPVKQNLQVFVRCRPLNQNEINQRCQSVVDVISNKEVVVRSNAKLSKSYAFDKVFDTSTSQATVYQNVVEPLISDVLSGFNCTVFAYGQTGSGKKHTMEGDITLKQIYSQESTAGLIPRAVVAVFDELRLLKTEYTVRISLIELYNEELFDLLSPDDVPPKLRMYDDTTRKGSVLLHGLQEVMVHSPSQVLEELAKGSAKRQVAATLMNAHSSRSHTIFSITVHSKENSVDGEELLKTGKLNLVDLAGSENIGRSGSIDRRAREAANINQSLLTLSRVTSCLVEHQPHVPYRESKLTRLLQDSLGGRTKTSLIATISPAAINLEETISTLDYALRAKSVANKPEVNQKVSQKVVMKEYMDLIEDLKKKLENHREGSGIYVNEENYRQTVQQKEAYNERILELIAEIRSLHFLKKEIEETYADLSTKREECKINVENLTEGIVQTSAEIEVVSETLVEAKSKQSETNLLLNNVNAKENELRSQANQLINICDSVQQDADKIHQRLESTRSILTDNEIVLEKLRSKIKVHQGSASKMIKDIREALKIVQKVFLSMGEFKTDEQAWHKAKQAFEDFTEKSTLSLERQFSLIKQLENTKKMSNEQCVLAFKEHLAQKAKHYELLELHCRAACTDVSRFLHELPRDISFVIESAHHCIEDIKKVTQTLASETGSLLDNQLVQLDTHFETVKASLDNIPVESDLAAATLHDKDFRKITSDLAAACSTLQEKVKINQVDMEKLKEEKLKNASIIKKELCSISNVKEQQSMVASQHDALAQVICEKIPDLRNCVNNQKISMVQAAQGGFLQKMEIAYEAAQTLLNVDVLTPLSQINQNKESCLQGIRNLSSVLEDSSKLPNDYEVLHQTVVSEYETLIEKMGHQQDTEEKDLKMCLTNIKASCAETIQNLENERASINEILASEIKYDSPTGQTPSRKSYGSIPELVNLPSPVVEILESKIKKRPWRKFMKSPKKPAGSLASLSNTDDCEGTSSDSEVTLIRRGNHERITLHKTSSLCDLRTSTKSNGVFRQPRIPHKRI